MATSPNKKETSATPAAATATTTDAAAEVKRKLAWRMGFAGLMIVGLLGALALFDRLSTPGESEATPPQFTEPVPVAKKVVTQPVTPAEPAAEPAKQAPPPPPAPAPAPEASAAPVDKSAPRSDRPPRPEVTAQPTPPRTPAVPSGRAAAPAAPPAASSTKAASTAPTRSEPSAARSEAPIAAESPAPSRLLSGYALQAGVFADPRRAEDLHARLVLEGIPATIESRVQVGPFQNRAEAEAMREKLKALGVDSVLLPPKGSKH